MKERKEKLIRVLQILQSTDKMSPINATQIVNRLRNDFDIEEVDRRSIYRDVALLTGCGYSIRKCDNPTLGWYMEKHTFEDWEIKIMMDSIMQARCVNVTEAMEIRKKLLSLTSNRGRSRLSHVIQPKSSNSEKNNNTGKYIECMLESMYLGKKITFQYTELNDNFERVLRKNGKRYELSLYTIVWSDNNYYLIGAHNNHDGLTNYRLDRLENMEMSDEDIIPAIQKVGENPELILQEYIEKSVNHFSGKNIRIELEFEPNQSTNGILYDFAGKDISIKKLDNGKTVARFSKLESVTLVSWLVQNATRFKVVKPLELQNQVRQEIIKSMEKYS